VGLDEAAGVVAAVEGVGAAGDAAAGAAGVGSEPEDRLGVFAEDRLDRAASRESVR
jgi:hypothetical protein